MKQTIPVPAQKRPSVAQPQPAKPRLPLARLILAALIPLGLLWPRVCGAHPALVERLYSAGAYPAIRRCLSAVTSLVPFSVAEFVLYALVFWALVQIAGSLLLLILRRVDVRRALLALLSVAAAAGVILNLFYFTWGFNYFRTPLAARMGLTVRARPVSELIELTDMLAGEAARLRETLPEDASGVFTLDGGLQAVLDALPGAYASLGETVPAFAGGTTRAKRVAFSTGLSYAGIAGVYIGITGEPNVNVAQPDLLLPQGAAHEMAHQLGIASEDEAEFSAYLACLCSPDARVRYSGVANALIHCRNALRKVDPEAAAAVRERYSDGVLRDFSAYDAYWDRFNGPVEDAVTNVNDAYLKHNAQETGVDSYGESVDLLLAYYDQTKN